MTDFEAVAEDIYRRKEELFNTGNLAKNIERLCQNNQPATPAIIQIAEELKIIADTNKVKSIEKEIGATTSISELNSVRSSSRVENLAPEVKSDLEDSFDKQLETLKKKELSKNDKFFVDKYKSQIRNARQEYEVVDILDKAEKDIAEPSNFDTVQKVGYERLEAIQTSIKEQEAKQKQRLESDDRRKAANARRQLDKMRERGQIE